MQQRLSIDDYRREAQRRLPRLVFDYVEGGAETESTVRANRQVYESVTFRPRGAMDPVGVDIKVSVLGTELAMPILLAPCGMSRLVHPRGDLAGARAAGRAGTIFVQSTMSGHTIEEVLAEAGDAPVWYQLYRMGPDSGIQRVIDQARHAGVAALVITIDSAGGSLRERDRRNGGMALLGSSSLRAAPHFFQLTRSPRWLVEHLIDGIRPQLPNNLDEAGRPRVLGRGGGPVGLTWADLGWVRKRWGGPIVVKGLVTAEDALRSVAEGADAVVVSNHGGRQLDGAEATLRVLPEVVAAVGDRCEVLVDGGIRSGADVLKAVSLGARAVMVGRPWLYGLAVGGDTGVEGALAVLADGVRRNLVLLGAHQLAELDRSYVRAPSEWFEPRLTEFSLEDSELSLTEEGLGKRWH